MKEKRDSDDSEDVINRVTDMSALGRCVADDPNYAEGQVRTCLREMSKVNGILAESLLAQAEAIRSMARRFVWLAFLCGILVCWQFCEMAFFH